MCISLHCMQGETAHRNYSIELSQVPKGSNSGEHRHRLLAAIYSLGIQAKRKLEYLD